MSFPIWVTCSECHQHTTQDDVSLLEDEETGIQWYICSRCISKMKRVNPAVFRNARIVRKLDDKS